MDIFGKSPGGRYIKVCWETNCTIVVYIRSQVQDNEKYKFITHLSYHPYHIMIIQYIYFTITAAVRFLLFFMESGTEV